MIMYNVQTNRQEHALKNTNIKRGAIQEIANKIMSHFESIGDQVGGRVNGYGGEQSKTSIHQDNRVYLPCPSAKVRTCTVSSNNQLILYSQMAK